MRRKGEDDVVTEGAKDKGNETKNSIENETNRKPNKK